jgi:hypothetical protein
MTVLALIRGVTVKRPIRDKGYQVLVLLEQHKEWWDCLCVAQATDRSVHDYTGETISVHADDIRAGEVFNY